jgi:membrane-associated phospholipid phosphatase
MKILILISQYVLKIYQTFLLTIPFFVIQHGLLTVNHWLIAFGVSAMFSNLVNWIAKTIIKRIYKISKRKSLPFLGIGDRPKGAKDCGAFTDCESCNLKTNSFGMPSGHSQIGWFFFIYGSLYMAEHIRIKYHTAENLYKARIWLSVGIVLLFLMAITLSYSRVYLNCHTVQQVIMGGIFGIGVGLLSYWISAMIIEGDKHVDIFDRMRKIFLGDVQQN